MNKKYTTFLCLISFIFGQVSIDNIDRLGNVELDLLREQLQNDVSTPLGLDSSTNISIESESPKLVTIDSGTSDNNNDIYFGYNYFKREINFFDNIPTPSDFKLGPGDEIILSLWGETNSRESFIINKDGLIYYENIGFLNLSNKTLKQAESVLVEELSSVYSTLNDKDNPTKLMLELGKIKSINVYFSGQIEIPGINLIHPFSDIFSAIVQAGGVKRQGSLRQVQLIRKNEVISTVDFYSFFTNGKNNFSSIKILDGDVIHIPIVSKRIQIQGEINNPGFFELLDDESLADLIQYAENLTANASSRIKLDKLVPFSERSSDDNAKLSKVVNVKTAANTKLNNGDVVSIGAVSDVDNKVKIFGRVKSPGEYPASLTLKEVLDIAGGFNDPVFRQSILENEIVVLRKDRNDFYGLTFEIPYKESDKFKLKEEDQIFVYEDSKYDISSKITVNGEVQKKGSFPLQPGMTVGSALNLAQGLTPFANPDAILIYEEYTSSDINGIISTSSEYVGSVDNDFILSKNSTITVLPYEDVVKVEGNVYSPGLLSYKKNTSLRQYVELAGGYKPNTLRTRIHIKRSNGKIVQNRKIALGLGKKIYPGDTIIIPVNENPQEFDITTFIADLSTTLANIAAILLIVDNQN